MNIVYSMTRNVYEWILPSMRSLAEHNPDADVYILAEDDTLPFDLPMPAQIINVSGQGFFRKGSSNYDNMFSYINLLKVVYPQILPFDKVIHLDLDTIICGSLTGLWDTDLSGKWFGAVQEYKGTYRPFGEKYYNMGIAVINLAQMREDGVDMLMQDYLNSGKRKWADQDAWNYYGLREDKIVPLDIRWNENCMTGYTDSPAIVHYCSYRDWWTKKNMFRVEFLNRYKKGGEILRILIAVPTYENITPDTFKAIYDMDKCGHIVDFEFIRGYDVAKARNLIAKRTLDGKYAYVLMVDNDETPPKDTLKNLLEGKPKMCVGYCLSRPKNAPNTNGRTTAFRKSGKQNYITEDAYTADELKSSGMKRIRIRGSGLGCALIHRSVFEKMRYPYFKWVEYANGGQLSEDLYFCEHVDTVYVDTRVRCGHLMRYIKDI